MNARIETDPSKFNRDEKGMPFYTGTSFILHAIIGLLLFGLGAWLVKLGLAQRETNLRLIESSVRVDVVAMPRMSIQELKSIELNSQYVPGQEVEVEAPAKQEKAAPEPEAKPEVADKSPTLIQEKKVSFADMLKQEANKKVVKKAAVKKEERKGLDTGTLKELKSLALAGNQLQKGTRLTGTSGTAEATVFGDYTAGLPDHLRSNWRLPSYLLEQDLRARVRVWVGTDGKVLKAEIYETSGNKEFDDRALAAVQKSSPLPVPPDLVKPSVLRGDILLGFPL